MHTSVGGDFTLAEDVGALRSLQLSASYVTFDFKDRIVRLEAVARIPDRPGAGDCGILGPDRLYEEFFKGRPRRVAVLRRRGTPTATASCSARS